MLLFILDYTRLPRRKSLDVTLFLTTILGFVEGVVSMEKIMNCFPSVVLKPILTVKGIP